MNHLIFSRSGLASIAVAIALAVPGAPHAQDQAGAGNWDMIRQSMFAGRTIEEDGAKLVELETPVRAEDAAVVPIAILGARRALPPEAVIPRPGRIRVEILGSLVPPAAPHAAEALRDEARRMILARLDEPDLAPAAATPGRT